MRTTVQALTCLLLAPLAAATLIGAAAAIARPISLDYAEPIVYAHAARVLNGEALYQPIDQLPYTVAAYPPLYYWAAAALQQLAGPGFAQGRMLSLACGLGAAICAAYLAAGRTRDILTGVLAALLFLGLGFPGDVPWLGLYRVDMLGVLLSLASVAVLMHGAPMRGHVLVAGVLAGLAVLTKQTFFAAAVAGTVWLWTMDRRRASGFALIVALTVGIPALYFEATTGAFLSNTIVANVSPFTATVLWDLGRELLVTQGVPLLLAAMYVAFARPWKTAEDRLLLLYWGMTAVSLLGIAKVGANHNYWIELAAVTASLAARFPRVLGRTFSVSRRPVAAGFAALTMLVTIVATAQQVPGLRDSVVTDIEELRFSDDYSHFQALVERVRIAPGAVLAEPLDVLALADRPVLLEPLIYSLMLEAGTWDPAPLVERICSGRIDMVVLGYSLDDAASMGTGSYTVWPPAILSAIKASMALESRAAGRFVYTPRPDTTPATRAC